MTVNSYIVGSVIAALVASNAQDYTKNGNNWNVGFCQTGTKANSKQSPIDLPTKGTQRREEMSWKWTGFPISIKVNSKKNPYTYTDYLLTTDPAGILQTTPDWYYEVFFPF